jgi:hypothetical protein
VTLKVVNEASWYAGGLSNITVKDCIYIHPVQSLGDIPWLENHLVVVKDEEKRKKKLTRNNGQWLKC